MALGNGNGNGNASRLEAVTESVWVRSVARISMMATPVLLVVGGWLGMEYLAAQKKAWDDQAALNEKLVDRLSDVSNRVLVIETERRMEGRYERRSRQPTHLPPAALPPPGD